VIIETQTEHGNPIKETEKELFSPRATVIKWQS
jgi:hypothetical protein